MPPARRAQRLRLDWLQWGDPAAPSALIHLWTDANGDGIVDANELGPLVGRVGPGAPVGSMDPGLRRPFTRDLLAGVETRLGPHLLVRLTGLDRRETHRIESVNEGLGPDAYAIRLVPDPGGDLASPADDQLLPVAERRAPGDADALVLTNPDGLDARYRGLELLFDLRLGGWLRMRLGGTAHRIDGEAASRGFRAVENDPGVVGELLDTPNADTNADGRLSFDRAYAIKLSGEAHAPAGFVFGWIARYQDGQPFARLVVVDDLPQGPDVVRAVANGRHRFAYTMTVDARLEKTVALGPRRLGLSLAAFNLLQARREVEEDVVTGPAFRTPTLVQPPRTVRVAMRLDF